MGFFWIPSSLLLSLYGKEHYFRRNIWGTVIPQSDSTVICFRKWFEWDKTGQGEVLGQHEPETHAERRDRRVWEVLSLLMWLLCLGTALRGVMLFLQIHVTCCPCLRHSPSLPPPALSFFFPLAVSQNFWNFWITEISAHMHINTHATLAQVKLALLVQSYIRGLSEAREYQTCTAWKKLVHFMYTTCALPTWYAWLYLASFLNSADYNDLQHLNIWIHFMIYI